MLYFCVIIYVMLPEATDEEIITAYKNGDQEAFRSLIDRYTGPLYNFSARLAGESSTPDIIQEIFIKVWKNLHRFSPEKASFKTWIFTIARNTITDFLRKKKSVVFSDLGKNKTERSDGDSSSFAENIPDEHVLPDAALQKLQDRKFLDETLKKLRQSYREILVLHYDEEMTFSEIGEILHKPLNTVKSDHRRALLELKNLLE